MDVFIIAAIVIGVLLLFLKATKNKSKLGINLKRVTCPACNEVQPVVRKPKNLNQVLFGETTCKCGANLDKFGDIVSD